MVVGLFESIDLSDGRSAGFYLVRFDAKGRCRSVRTQAQFLDAAAHATDVFVFSHGCNNVCDVALRQYRSFVTGYYGPAPGIPPPPARGLPAAAARYHLAVHEFRASVGVRPRHRRHSRCRRLARARA